MSGGVFADDILYDVSDGLDQLHFSGCAGLNAGTLFRAHVDDISDVGTFFV